MMDDQVERYPFIQSLNRLIDNRLDTFRQSLTQSLPCEVVDIDDSNTIVKVKFLLMTTTPLPIVQMPVFGPEFVRWPIGPGTIGVALSASATLAFVTGLASDEALAEGIATEAPPSNLGAGVFFPLGNLKNTPTDDARQTIIYGPEGVQVRNADNTCRIEVDKNGNVIIWGARSLSTDVNGYGTRTTYMGGLVWQVDIYDLGITVNTTHHPVIPPEITPPPP